MRRKPIVIDLNDDSMGTLRIRRWMPTVGMILLVGAIVSFVLWAVGIAGDRGIISAIFLWLSLVLPHYATLCFYLSEVRQGTGAAIRGLLVGCGIGAVLGGWECAWTTSRLDISLGLLGAGVGLLAGAFFGMILGVFLGWAERRIRSTLVKSTPQNLDPGNGLGDRWLDEA